MEISHVQILVIPTVNVLQKKKKKLLSIPFLCADTDKLLDPSPSLLGLCIHYPPFSRYLIYKLIFIFNYFYYIL